MGRGVEPDAALAHQAKVLNLVPLAAVDQVHLLNPISVDISLDEAPKIALEKVRQLLVRVEDQEPVSARSAPRLVHVTARRDRDGRPARTRPQAAARSWVCRPSTSDPRRRSHRRASRASTRHSSRRSSSLNTITFREMRFTATPYRRCPVAQASPSAGLSLSSSPR